jgi:hypothetical protein
MFKSKGFIIVLLSVLVIVISGFTFAYWANSVKDSEKEVDGNVEVGTGQEVITQVNVTSQSGKTLVPIGRAEDSNEADAVEVVHLTYTVTWTEERSAAEGTIGILNTEIENIAIDGNNDLGTTYASVEIISSKVSNIMLDGEAVTVTVKVTLNEPNREDYLLVAGKNITFDIKFGVSVQ